MVFGGNATARPARTICRTVARHWFMSTGKYARTWGEPSSGSGPDGGGRTAAEAGSFHSKRVDGCSHESSGTTAARDGSASRDATKGCTLEAINGAAPS